MPSPLMYSYYNFGLNRLLLKGVNQFQDIKTAPQPVTVESGYSERRG
jgi:hypothetical protein